MITDDDEMLAPAAPGLAASTMGGVAEDDGDGGISDRTRIVRIWLEEGRLAQVRVSPRWHAKLRNSTLDSCFSQALALGIVKVSEPAQRSLRTYTEADFGPLPRFSAQTLAAFHSRLADVRQRWDEALERRRAEGLDPLRTVGTSQGVTVALNAGVTASVGFDAKWLENAQAGHICTHVMRASEKAYAELRPPSDVQTELSTIEEEHHFLLSAFEAVLNPRDRR